MLECIYCMLHVLSASPLAALAKSSGTTNTMRVECVIHVSLRMYILVMSISISFYLILSICCDEKMLKYSLIYVQSFYLSWSFSDYVVYFLCGPIFQLCGLFAMWSIYDFLIFQNQFRVFFSTFTMLFASVCCMRLQFCAIPAST